MLDFRDLASASQGRRAVRLLAKAILLAAMLAMSGCSGQLPGMATLNALKSSAAKSPAAKLVASPSPDAKASLAKKGEPASSAADWGGKYSADPKNRLNALNYADMLARNGRTDQAVAVLLCTAVTKQATGASAMC